MRRCSSSKCRNNSKKYRSAWMRLICPQSPPRTQTRLLVGFARDANKDAQGGRTSGGACSEGLRSAESHGTNIRYPLKHPDIVRLAAAENHQDS